MTDKKKTEIEKLTEEVKQIQKDMEQKIADYNSKVAECQQNIEEQEKALEDAKAAMMTAAGDDDEESYIKQNFQRDKAQVRLNMFKEQLEQIKAAGIASQEETDNVVERLFAIQAEIIAAHYRDLVEPAIDMMRSRGAAISAVNDTEDILEKWTKEIRPYYKTSDQILNGVKQPAIVVRRGYDSRFRNVKELDEHVRMVGFLTGKKCGIPEIMENPANSGRRF